jgi:hypothetical protein
MGIRFDHPDLALRIAVGDAVDRRDRIGRLFVSRDRGRRWSGPFRFPGLGEDPRLEGLEVTSRTDVLVTGPASALLMLSARDPRLGNLSDRLDKTFAACTRDGGRSFQFLSWVVPWSDPHRAVMPSTVRLRPSGHLVTALRRMDPRRPEASNWVDLYGSSDDGASWSPISRVGETGSLNGNPASLLQLRDGRLACAYGNRSSRRMIVRLSSDEGRHWGPELVIREIPFHFDFGYPQLSQNHQGDVVVIYYLTTEERPHSFIEAALFSPPPRPA